MNYTNCRRISQCEYLLENDNLSAEDKEEIAVILRQAKRMSKLTSEMLMIARNEQDEQHLMEKLDFGLLKKCIQMETERSGCTRIRFTKPDKDGNVQQYLVKQDPRDIGFKDLSGMGSLAKADELMQQWAYETFDGDDIPMCEFTMLKLPEGYNGFFVHMDHRLIDSCGLVVMIGDLFQLYTYYKYGTAYPQELADFETVLKKDLAKAGNEKRFAKDKKFWDDQLDALGGGVRPLVVLAGEVLHGEHLVFPRKPEVLAVHRVHGGLGEDGAGRRPKLLLRQARNIVPVEDAHLLQAPQPQVAL